MALTKAERREAWKESTTATATALREAGATVSASTGERSVPLSSPTITTRHGTVTSRQIAAPPTITTRHGETFSQPIGTHVTTAPRFTSPSIRQRISTAPILSRFAAAGAFVGDRARIAGEKFAERRPAAAKAIHEPFEQFAAGTRYGAGEDVYVPSVKPTEKFITRPVTEWAVKTGADYRRFIESHRDPIEQIIGHGLAVGGPPGTQPMYAQTFGKAGVGVAQAPAGFLEMGGMVPFGFEYGARHPKETAMILPVAIGAMIGGTVRSFRERPWETGGEFGAMILGPKMLGKVPVPKTPAWVPKTTIISRKPPTPSGLIPEKATKFEAGYKLTKEFETTQPATKPIDFTQVKYLPETAGPAVEQWIRTHPKQDPVIGGSTAAQAHFPSARRGADIDILVKDPKKASAEIFQTVKKELGAEKVRLTSDPRWDAYAVETKTATGWHHAVDIHKTVEPGSQLRLGFETQSPIDIKGIKYQRAGELLQRKGETVLQPSDPGMIGPTETFRSRRMKDIPDFDTYISDLLKIRKEQAGSARLFSGYKQKQVGKLEDIFKTYQMHSYVGPDPYMVVAASRGYGTLPLSARTGMALVGVSRYPVVRKGLPEKAYDIYPSTKKDDGYYPAPSYPVTERPYSSSYRPAQKEDYYSPVAETYDTPTGYSPTYTPAKEEPYTPVYESPYKPPYEPPYEPIYTPLYPPPKEPLKIPRFKLGDEQEKKRKKEYEPLTTKKTAFHPWFPASLEYVNLEESMTGKRAIHIKPRKTTQKLFKGLITKGRGIQTKAQYETKLPKNFM